MQLTSIYHGESMDVHSAGCGMAEIPESALADGSLGAARILLAAMYRLTPRGHYTPIVWPRTATLAKMIGSDPRTVQRHLVRLETAGYIRTTDEGWLLALRSDGSRAEWASDNIVAKADRSVDPSVNIVVTRRQDCRPKATILSPPTLEEPGLEPGSDGVEQSPATQLELVSPGAARDEVAELWAYQQELRVWAFAKHGRTGRSGPRAIRLDSHAKRSVERSLREHGYEGVRAALRECAKDAAETAKSLSYFDGVSNWRPGNFSRFANASPGLLALRTRTEVRAATAGAMMVECANEKSEDLENCERPDDTLRARGAVGMSEVLG